MASIGLSDAKFNWIRVFFGGALSPMAGLPALQKALAYLMTLFAMEISLLNTGVIRPTSRGQWTGASATYDLRACSLNARISSAGPGHPSDS